MGAEAAPSVRAVSGNEPFLSKLLRRKPADVQREAATEGRLARTLSVFQLIPLGVGSTIGAGVYVLVGTVARERSGPALVLSFLIAGIAAALSALCYAELSSRCPSAGSAYHYSYICIGEGIAWLIGWALILEYTVGGSAVARGISPNLAVCFGGENNLPVWLARMHIPGTEIIVDPCAALLVMFVTTLLCLGVKESATVQAMVTSANVCVLVFVILTGIITGFRTGWLGYKQPNGFLPFGLNGMLSGAGEVFFAYIGFDTVASMAEEVKHPQRDLPLGIGSSLFICGSLYMLISAVLVGVVPYYELDLNTPISSVFAQHGMPWAVYIVTIGAVAALSAALMGSLLPQPRILIAMSRDGLLPYIFLRISKTTAVPVNGTLATGLLATLMAFFMDVDQLSGMVSVGTLLAFLVVAISVLVVRYVTPANTHDLPADAFLPISCPASPKLGPKSLASLPGHGSASSKRVVSEQGEDETEDPPQLDSHESTNITIQTPLLSKQRSCEGKKGNTKEENRRWAAAMSILAVCTGGLLIAVSAAFGSFPSWLRWTLATIGVLSSGGGAIMLALLEEDERQHTFGHSGGFICPFIPWLPVASIIINIYLLVELGFNTWIRVGIWLLLGLILYFSYGLHHGSLAIKDNDTVTN